MAEIVTVEMGKLTLTVWGWQDYMRFAGARGRAIMAIAISVATMNNQQHRVRVSVLGSLGSPNAQAATNPPNNPPIWA
ncbi:MAG TPA: hypothetical protein PLM83_06705 [Bacillota bacterium]|nr:hypothetical protein [Bacillota bacterium]